MTVRELIDALSDFEPDSVVVINVPGLPTWVDIVRIDKDTDVHPVCRVDVTSSQENWFY